MRGLRSILMILILLVAGMGDSFADQKEILVVDRFSGGADAQGIPKGWSLEKNPGPQSKISVEREKGDFFLRLLSVQDAFGVQKEISFDLRQYPDLSWRWRAIKLPEGGDIRKRETDDQAGQIYVLFPRFPSLVNIRSIGYIWDTTAPVGTSGTSTAYSRMKYVVLQSGKSKLGQWITEKRNVHEDYRKLFGEDPPRVGAVLLYINSQHTQSSCEIQFEDIFFAPHPPELSKE